MTETESATATERHPEKQNSTIEVVHRTKQSPSTYLLYKFLRPLRTLLLKAPDPVSGESQKIKIPKKAREECDIDERQVEGIWIYDFKAKKPSTKCMPHNKAIPSRKKRVYYFPGGGWSIPASEQHVFLCSALATRMPNTVISVVSYLLAPESPAPVSFPQMCELYKVLLDMSAQADETVILAGDSAGGNIVLTLPLHVLSHDPQARAPTAIMAISPSTDLRRSNPKIEQTAKHDPILTPAFIKSTANVWRDKWDAWDVRVSPLAADVKILADKNIAVHGATGTYDILYPDAILFRDKLAAAGVKGRWLEWEKQMHVWMLTARYGLPEARKGIDWVAQVLNEV